MLEDASRRRITLEASGVEIALLDWGGDGPLALLHHANGFCAATWALVAERLRPHFRVVAMDARGHGHSTKLADETAYAWPRFGEDAAAVARSLAADHPDGRIALGLGHSFGGTSLMLASAEVPDLFERLVLVDPVLPPPVVVETSIDPTRAERGRGLAEGARRRRHEFPDRDAARAAWEGKAFFRDWDSRALDLYVAEALRDRPDGSVELRCSPRTEAAIFFQGRGFDTWESASRVTIPSLLLWAEHGNFPRVVYEAVVERMKDARIRGVPTGHLVPMERPDLVADEALAFYQAKEECR
jgi:pimeloyl-ACP methyl ester carboxylesterase